MINNEYGRMRRRCGESRYGSVEEMKELRAYLGGGRMDGMDDDAENDTFTYRLKPGACER